MSFVLPQLISPRLGQQTIGQSYDVALVVSVILDLNDIDITLPELDKLHTELKNSDYVTKNAGFYGGIVYRAVMDGMQETNEQQLTIAYPLNKNFLTLPVISEVVKIYDIAGRKYYDRITHENSPSFDTDTELLILGSKRSKENTGATTKIDSYQSTEQTGIAETNSNSGQNVTIKNGFAGKYFKRNMRIHQLALNEGDTLFQGRFGNSIRFSGYIHDNKDNGIAYPAILIRNGESADNKKKKVYDVVSEDVNADGTSIQITSGQYKTLYNSTTIKVNKEANSNYPSSDNLIGDQIVVNSGRVILSSKTAETFLFSKKTFSIFTDDVVTIDTDKGYKLISQNGNIEITAKNNKNVILAVGSGGKVFHGKDGADQQAILGNKLVDLLGQLIDAIDAMTIATPSGPSAPGPIDKSTFNNIKNQLKDTLSKNNYLI